ncbi:MAG: response regulator [Candidatus Ozemobacter sibiricus]|uniref:Response regulator n=1 Tax=Candidatus Ozemobacter sibiricus TaxID=2268124 RepID=A0A367ZKB0_9BACT|nr:MAG: response regulator [Candidatus Ozemobacter sibiricus]
MRDELTYLPSPFPDPEVRPVILLAEDEPLLRDVITEFLTREGYRVVAAADGEEAWRFFEGDPDRFALLLTDERMPGLTGTALATRVRKSRPTLPIVFMSGHLADLPDRQAWLEAGAHIFSKPFPLEDLLQAVVRILPPPLPET